ncbi:unnamed protein product, partial [Ectocarpus sp. 13 AM-2016]
QVTREDGTLEFVSYDEKIVLDTGETCSTTVAVGLYYNDVWEYDLNCTRWGRALFSVG